MEELISRPKGIGDPIASRFLRHLLMVSFVFSPLLAGCKGLTKLTGKQEKDDLLEAELRTREREILEARSEMNHLRQTLEIYQRQGPGYVPFASPVPIHQTSLASGHPLRGVLLGNGTGGIDNDGVPGDESLQVVIVPKDEDGTPTKSPGHVTVTAQEITKEGLKRSIGRWEVSNDQLRKTWKTGFISNGYHVPLQWDRPPTTDRVRVTIQFQTPEGRAFEADRDVTVVPMPGVTRPMPGELHSPIPIQPDLSPTLPEVVDQLSPLPPPTIVPPGAQLLPAQPR